MSNLLLAQEGLVDPVRSIAYSSFAPELLLVGVALFLMLLTVAEENRSAVAIPAGVLAGAVGVWLITSGLLLPGAVVVAVAAAVVALPFAFEDEPALISAWLAALSALGALVLTGWQWAEHFSVDGGLGVARLDLGGSLAFDGIALFTRITVYATVVLAIPVGYGYLKDRGIHRPEFEQLMLLSAVGMTILGAAADLITAFIAVETLSLALYVMAGLARRDRRSQEAAIKYFVMGAVASALLLYGMALLYIATGSVEIAAIAEGLGLVTAPGRVAYFGLALVTVGLGFKVALVPFHLWTPDVYQGAPTNVTAFMAAATKAAGFAFILRMYLLGFGRLVDAWVPVLAVLAAITMILGAVVALVQSDVKRILAYSSLAHAGYAAIGVAAGGLDGLSSTLWYLLTYAVTVVGAFACVIAIERRRKGEVALVDLRGLGKRSPALAGLFTLALLSLAGIPPTAGFQGKLAVFQAGVSAGLEWLVVVGVLSSVIAAFFYLRIMAMMFLEEPEPDAPEPNVSTGLSLGLAASAAAVVVLGVLPATLLTLADNAATLAR